jgi:signal transduction histidine kinase
MAHDEYIPSREEQTVVLELRAGDHVLATLNTVLDPEQEDEAAELAREVVDALVSGHVVPTATALEQYADRLR